MLGKPHSAALAAAAAAPLGRSLVGSWAGRSARTRGQTCLPKFGAVVYSRETVKNAGNRRNQCRFLGVHAGHARISCSWYVVGYFDHTGARGGYQGHAMGRWPDMADTQTWLPLAVPTLPSKKTICACESRPPPLLLKMLCIHQGSGALNRFASFFPCMYTGGVANFGCRGRQMGLCRDSSPYVPGASAAVTL